MLPNSDVSVANKVAQALGLEHRQLVAGDGAAVDVADLLERFILTGEGRHDHMNRLDAGTTLPTLYQEGTASIVRGDEGFGWKPADTPLAVRQSMELMLCSDIANFRPHLAAFGLQDQTTTERFAAT